MGNKLRIQICSDIDYKNLISEIYCDDKFVALISEEEKGQFLLEFPGPGFNEEAIIRKVDPDWFVNAVQEAKKKLIGMDEPRQT